MASVTSSYRPVELLERLPDEQVAHVLAYYERCSRGESSPLDELRYFDTLPNAPALCLRLAARLGVTLLPQWNFDTDTPTEGAAQLARRLREYLPSTDTAVHSYANLVLCAALGLRVALPVELTGDILTSLPDCNPALRTGSFHALQVLLDYTLGCLRVPDLDASTHLRLVAGADLV